MADTPTGRRGTRNAARTPTGRLNVEPPSSSRPVYTPLNRATPTSARRGPSSAGPANAPTPHAAAALRAQSLRRRAMLTPGRSRGQQGTAIQRDSPMGLLQQLGRQLAPTTRPIESSSPRDSIPSSVPRPRRSTTLAQEVTEEEDDPELPEMQPDDESEPELTKPQLSLPINEDDDDDTLPIPQPSDVPDDTSMYQASERGRRTTYGRPPRISGISAPGSEFADETGEPSDFLGLFENVQAGPGVDTSYYHEEDSRRETIGGQSEIALPMPVGYEDQSTFHISEADAALGQTSPLPPIPPETARAGNAAARDVTGNVTLADADDLDDDDGGAAFGEGPIDYGDYAVPPYDEEPSRTDRSKRISRIESLDEDDDELELAFEPPRRRSSVREAQSLLRTPGRGRPKGSVSKKKVKKLSQLGAEYPPLPPNFVKRVAQRALQNSSLNNPRISADVVTALTQASDWFFEQLGDDLGAYAEHAGRDVIDEADVITLMRRQRQVTNEATMFSLAQRHLPRELLQEIRMPMPLIDEED